MPRRPTTDRSKALATSQVALLVNAHTFAASQTIRRPLNALLTIVWRHSPYWTGPDCWATFQTRLMDQLTRWLRRNGVDTAFVWAREAAHGKGPHTHFLIHLGSRPNRLRAAMVEWLRSTFAFEPEGVDVSLGKFGAQTNEMRAGMLRYIVKGIDHATFRYSGFETRNVAAELGISHRGHQGMVRIKRAGTSENIGPKARAVAGWREIRAIPDLAKVLTPDGIV